MTLHKRTRAAVAITLVVVVVLAVAVAGGQAWVRRHVERVSAGSGADGRDCMRCHLLGAQREEREVEHARFPSPASMALDPGGAALYVTARGTGEVVTIALTTLAVTRHFQVGAEPRGVAVSPDGTRLFVALQAEHRVVAIHAASGVELGSAAVGQRPCGLCLTGDGATLIVANSGSDDVSLLDARTLTERARLAAGREPYDVALSPDGRFAYVANRLAALGAAREVPHSELTVIDVARGRVVRRHELESAHLSEGVAVSSARGIALVSLVRTRNTLPITQVAQGWVMNSGLGVLLPGEDVVRQFPLDDVNAYFADPAGVAVDDLGGRAYVASGGGDCVSVVDLRRIEELVGAERGGAAWPWADHLGVSSEYVLARLATAPNPRGLLLSPRGERLYVAEHLGDSIAIFDTARLELVGRVALGAPQFQTLERRGEIVFHRAAISFQGQFSCRSCHPDGHVDGLVYDFAIDGVGRNLLDNRSLLAIAETAPFKWNGKNKDLHEQCGPRFAKVLTFSDPFTPADLDALVAYMGALAPLPRRAEPDEARERGRQIFERTQTRNGEEIPLDGRCTTCHPAPHYTNRLSADVKTKAPGDSGAAFDTPHLTGVVDSAPYLHDGRARTLEEIWTVHSPQNTHGYVNDLSKSQLNDLVAFLESL